MWETLKANPVLVGEVVRNIILVPMAFDLIQWTEGQFATVMIAIGSIIALMTRDATVANPRVDQKVAEQVAHREMTGETGSGNGLVQPRILGG